MAAVHSQVQGSQDPYHRLPPPPAPGPYQRPPDMYAQPPPGSQVVYQAAAPRQRTAIACRYCRRRKIRCSGFESSPDGRCTNCVRFNQECMFTPVSSQAQAFVPAHAAYPHLLRPQAQGGRGRGYPGDNVVLYGAHGQPLPPQQQAMPESTLPPPQGAYYQAPYGRPPHMDDRIPPPPMQHHVPHDQRQQGGRRGSGAGFDYPDPINLAPVSAGPPAPGFAPAPYYHAPPQDRRPSPQSYAYDRPGYPPMPAHGTPPPIATSGPSRGGLNVRDILNNPPGDSAGTNGGRSSTDSDMLNQLNRKV
ncbi:C6 transcription factor, putative [Talaromyces marneffei ATCC 18224]|uniref:C6 transcription factor, putative n=2 Tax=Talaromyces marneffei TaxID=37727 RepID=B6Q2I8_TALMQ|nr:C6 transcription factor, putative [Talaromyces marneffei ATCC 18224]